MEEDPREVKEGKMIKLKLKDWDWEKVYSITIGVNEKKDRLSFRIFLQIAQEGTIKTMPLLIPRNMIVIRIFQKVTLG